MPSRLFHFKDHKLLYLVMHDKKYFRLNKCKLSGRHFNERLTLMQLAASIDDRIEPKPFKTELFDHNDPLVDEIQKNGIPFI